MDEHLMEDFVVLSINRHLVTNGFEIIDFATGRNHGIDVHARNGGQTVMVEAKGAKGNPKNGPTKRDKFDSGQIKDHLGKAIVKVLELKNDHPTAELWIAHPDTPAIRKIVDPIKNHLLAIGLKFVYVAADGQVRFS